MYIKGWFCSILFTYEFTLSINIYFLLILTHGGLSMEPLISGRHENRSYFLSETSFSQLLKKSISGLQPKRAGSHSHSEELFFDCVEGSGTIIYGIKTPSSSSSSDEYFTASEDDCFDSEGESWDPSLNSVLNLVRMNDYTRLRSIRKSVLLELLDELISFINTELSNFEQLDYENSKKIQKYSGNEKKYESKITKLMCSFENQLDLTKRKLARYYYYVNYVFILIYQKIVASFEEATLEISRSKVYHPLQFKKREIAFQQELAGFLSSMHSRVFCNHPLAEGKDICALIEELSLEIEEKYRELKSQMVELQESYESERYESVEPGRSTIKGREKATDSGRGKSLLRRVISKPKKLFTKRK
ncbi:E3 ubiquitin-protein ligase TOM1-like protein [Cryptosporidium felis]|nr:E3 ubiquitin-protein ligase TOM1-like protein [Cryptosporidium felis]